MSTVYLQERIKLTSEIHSRAARSVSSKKVFAEKEIQSLKANLFTLRATNLWDSLHRRLTSLKSFNNSRTD